jgi:hypothetical protein
MANKINNYNGLTGLIKDGAIGAILSTGIMSTLLPNGIESLGKVQELNSFFTLNLFSVVYFLFPIVIFTTYWLIRGSKSFFFEKFDLYETQKFRTLAKTDSNKFVEWKSLLVLLKLLPLLVFIVNESFYSSWGKGVYGLLVIYLLVAFLQLYISYTSNKHLLIKLDIFEKRKAEFLYRSFCIDALIYFLDIIIALILIAFTKPWLLYTEGFYACVVATMAGFGIATWSFSFTKFKNARLNIEDFVLAVLVAVSGLSFPAINLSGFCYASRLTLLCFILISIVWLFSKKSEGSKNYNLTAVWRVVIPCVVLLISSIFWVELVVSPSLEKINLTFLKHRYEAFEQFPKNEVFPFTKATSGVYRADKKAIQENEYSNIAFVKENLGAIYYPEYDSLEKIVKQLKSSKLKSDDIIDSLFYDSLTKQYQSNLDSFYKSTFAKVDSLNPDIIRINHSAPEYKSFVAYLHPVDYIGSKLARDLRFKKGAEEMVRQSEALVRYASIEKIKPANSNVNEVIMTRRGKSIESLENLYKNSIDLRDFRPALSKISSDSSQSSKLLKFHRIYFEVAELRYNESYKSTQKVYRSYLVDSQRLGVWTFLVTVLVLALASYYNSKANKELGNSHSQREEDNKSLPIDTPKNSLFIQLFIVFFLLIPLLKHIAPENIDPEKPYWMISLQNWYTPNFIKGLTEKDEARPNYYSSGRTTIENNIDFKVVETALKELTTESQKTKEEIKNINRNINKLNEILSKGDDQIN